MSGGGAEEEEQGGGEEALICSSVTHQSALSDSESAEGTKHKVKQTASQ